MDPTEERIPEDRWKPTRNAPAHRQTGSHGRWALTPEQLALADDLHTRALALRAASEEGLSIREAVALAAVQLGLHDSAAACPVAAENTQKETTR